MKLAQARLDKLEIKQVELGKIDISDSNVRKSVEEMMVTQKEQFDSLVKSIRDLGVLQPVIVVKKGDRFELPVGQCRFLAAKDAALNKIPAIVYESMSTVQMKTISAIENLQRIDLSPIDKAAAIKDLVNALGGVEHGGIKKTAKQLGYSEPWVREQLGLEGMPIEVKNLVEQGELSTHDAAQLKPLLRYKKPDEMTELAKEIVKLKGDERIVAIKVVKRNPTITPATLKGEIKKHNIFLSIRIDFSDLERDALLKAAEDEGTSPEDLAHSAVNDWLKRSGYLA